MVKLFRTSLVQISLFLSALTGVWILSLPFYAITVSSANAVAAITAPGFDQSHNDWTEVLKKYGVQNGSTTQIKYADLHRNSSMLNKYLKIVSRVSKKSYDQFSEQEKLAFLINAYNAFTLKIVGDWYPVKSIKNIGSPSTPWKLKFFVFLGRNTSLDDVDHDLQALNEPRYRFALNAAAQGYPSLRAEAYTGENLDAQLNDQIKVFLRDPERNQIDTANKTLKLAQFLSDNKEDLTKNSGSLQKFIAPFITDDPLVQTALKNDEYSVSFTEFNWNLNNATH